MGPNSCDATLVLHKTYTIDCLLTHIEFQQQETGCKDAESQKDFCPIWKNAKWCEEKQDIMEKLCPKTCYDCNLTDHSRSGNYWELLNFHWRKQHLISNTKIVVGLYRNAFVIRRELVHVPRKKCEDWKCLQVRRHVIWRGSENPPWLAD